MNRRAPRPLAAALASLAPQLAPATTLARVQAVWERAVGPALAAHCVALSERGGVLSLGCDEAVWSAEVELMGPEIVGLLCEALGSAQITAIRVRTSPPEALDLHN